MQETCKDCGGRIYWVGQLGVWYHWNGWDMLTCPGEEVEPASQVVEV